MTRGDEGKLFIFFVPLFTLSLVRKIVCSLCTDFGSARAPLYKLATCARQIFFSKLKLLQTRQTGRKNKSYRKQNLVMIKHCSEELTN